MNKVILMSTLLVSLFAVAQGKEAKGPHADVINTACAADAAIAKCDGEKVGTGLIKCLHKYKKATPDFKFSPACKEALKEGKEARKEKQEKKS